MKNKIILIFYFLIKYYFSYKIQKHNIQDKEEAIPNMDMIEDDDFYNDINDNFIMKYLN